MLSVTSCHHTHVERVLSISMLVSLSSLASGVDALVWALSSLVRLSLSLSLLVGLLLRASLNQPAVLPLLAICDPGLREKRKAAPTASPPPARDLQWIYASTCLPWLPLVPL